MPQPNNPADKNNPGLVPVIAVFALLSRGKRFFWMLWALALPVMADIRIAPTYLECQVEGKSFDQVFKETVLIKIDDQMIDVVSKEFPMFAKVERSETRYSASKRFKSSKGVNYFFSIEIDRVSGRFAAYETAATPDRKIYNTTGSGPCKKINESHFLATRPDQGSTAKQSMRVTIRRPGSN